MKVLSGCAVGASPTESVCISAACWGPGCLHSESGLLAFIAHLDPGTQYTLKAKNERVAYSV